VTGLFLIALLAGLGLGTYAMIRGVERHDPAQPIADALGREVRGNRIAWWLPAAAGALTVFGLVAYLTARLTTLSDFAVIAIGLVGSGLGAVTAHVLVSRWAVPAAAREPEDPRFVLQGHPARVRRPIAPDGVGEVSYEANGRHVVVAARSVDGTAIADRSDVIIERLEGDVAYVELWSRVEERI
jgi:hypothetical protein